MQHRIPLAQLRTEVGAFAPAMGEALSRCVHCGFCLADCPTYRVTGEEAESPRGRIFLMKEALEGSLDVEEAAAHVDGCLGCLACVTSCPSGVEYGELMVPFRSWSEPRREGRRGHRLQRRALLAALTSPGRLRWALRLGRWAKPFKGLLPRRLHPPLDLLPEPTVVPPAPRVELAAPRRARVLLLEGCAQSVLEPGINAATTAVFARNGIEVVEPADPGCCGALEQHGGELDAARRRAARLVRSFAELLDRGELDAVITTAAGCGSGIKEYPLLFGGTELEDAARKVSRAARDASSFLAEIGVVEQGLGLDPERVVVVQDACHLAHAQRETAAPRRLLSQIDGLRLVEARDAALCCGSAGTYNLEQPEMAAELGRRKCAALSETGADWVATGNVGCLTQLRHHFSRARPGGPDRVPRVLHTLQILDLASSSKPAN